jgi:hypothetical protein
MATQPFIKLDIKTINDYMWTIQIIHQAEIEFPRFTATNGVQILSFYCPQWDLGSHTLYVRGSMPEHDNDLLTVNVKEKELIEKAILDFNRSFKKTSWLPFKNAGERFSK